MLLKQKKGIISRSTHMKLENSASTNIFNVLFFMKKEILKKKYNLKVAVVSNEGFELNDYRIKTFKLKEFVDFFICSGFVHFRKPDKDIYRIALNTAQVDASKVIYLEDRMMFVQVAESLGIRGIRHTDHKTTE